MEQSPVVAVLDAFESVAEQDIAAAEYQAMLAGVPEAERALLYAMRVSKCLPHLKKLDTLASRWQVANGSPERTGLAAGLTSPNHARVREKLAAMYLQRFDDLAGALVTEIGKALDTSPKRAPQTIARGKALLERAVAQFVPELPGLDAKATRWRALLGTAAEGLAAESPATEVTSVPQTENGELLDSPNQPVQVELEVSFSTVVNFAMEHTGVPMVQAVRIRNAGTEVLHGATLEVALSPDLGEPVRIALPAIRPGEQLAQGPLDLRLPIDRLRNVLEAEPVDLRCAIWLGDTELATRTNRVQLLAFNEWPGGRAPTALLAVFVTPNHPVIAATLKRVRNQLRASVGDDAISGYQRRSRDTVISQLRALYNAVQALNLSYVGMPASFEESGQKIRLAHQLLAEQMGNCLDLSLFFASCLEQMGLWPLLILVDGHAFPAIWTEDDGFSEGVVADVERVRNQIALGKIVPFDASTAISGDRPVLELAVKAAERLLGPGGGFRVAIDVHAVRRAHFRPLPVRLDPLEQASSGEERTEGTEPSGDGAQQLLEEAIRERVPEEPEQTPALPTTVDLRFRQWQEKLLDLSLHNRLLNFQPDSKSAIRLQVADLSGFEDLFADGRAFTLMPRPDKDARDQRASSIVEARERPEDLHAELLAEVKAGRIRTSLTDADLVARGRVLYRAARVELEESGSNTLFAALGLVKWYEAPTSEIARFAPLLFVPLRLSWEPKSRTLTIRRGDEDAGGNVTLAQKMKDDFHLDLGCLVDLASDGSGIDVPLVFKRVREAIQRMPRWEVVEDSFIGLFSFSKFLMWRDLEQHKDQLLVNPVVRHIARGAREPLPDPVGPVDDAQLDEILRVSELPMVVDADASQVAAVLSAIRGRSFVLQGPPGTGKSQTITNLIAAALATGKRVLFVSEKMAALEVVQRRLKQVGLEDFCLELHSNKASRKNVVDALARALNRRSESGDADWEQRSEELTALRARLNTYVRCVHAARPIGKTYFEVLGRLLDLEDAQLIRIELGAGSAHERAVFAKQIAAARELSLVARAVEPVPEHPWRASALTEWRISTEQAIAAALEKAVQHIGAVESAVSGMAGLLGLELPLSRSALAGAAQLTCALASGPAPAITFDDANFSPREQEARDWAALANKDEAERVDLGRRWRPGVFDQDLTAARALVARHAESNAVVAWFGMLKTRGQLKPFALGDQKDRRRLLADLERVAACQERRPALQKDEQRVREVFGVAWAEAPADRTALLGLLDRLRGVRSAMALWRSEWGEVPSLMRSVAEPALPEERRTFLRQAAVSLQAALEGLQSTLAHLADLARAPDLIPAVRDAGGLAHVLRILASARSALSMLRPWTQYRRACESARELALGPVVDAHQRGEISAQNIVATCERSVLQRWLEIVVDEEPSLRDFDAIRHEEDILRFSEMDQRHIDGSRRQVIATLDARRPSSVAATAMAEGSEPGILMREHRKQNRHIPLRKLFQQIPNLLPRLKPCVLMSPLSVAQYLPVGQVTFDLVVFDEASQIGTHDAIGAIGRGNQVVVVGDSKQLPPTAFFTRESAQSDRVRDENDVEELESVLDEALACRLPEQYLRWHYRSRHESLISFSNRSYYEGKLCIFPAARSRVSDLGIKWHPVPNGVYKIGERTNQIEARALVDHLVGELQRSKPGTRSFGVVTFSVAQQTLVQDLLDDARAEHLEIDGHFSEDLIEPVFVKNLENVQGDERDEIYFSICYAPDENGRLLMNFGPVNRQGGERRLNVAVTRARRLVRVFSTLTHDRIDLNRTQARGARDLRAYLQFAAEQNLAIAERTPTPLAHESDFERQVWERLSTLGYGIECQVGVGGYRVDMAVRHPTQEGVYVLGIECDGMTYHSGRTARDRDRLRQSVLEGLGWRIHRIWSTDWWLQREREVERAVRAIEEAMRAVLTHGSEALRGVATDSLAPVVLPDVSAALPGAPPAAPAAILPEVPEPPPRAPSGPPSQPYRRATPRHRGDMEAFHASQSLDSIRACAEDVTRVEGPVHVVRLCRSVVAAFGGTRVTERVRERITAAVSASPQLAIVGDFVWSRGAEHKPLDAIRTAVDGDSESLRTPDEIPVQELGVAAEWILVHSLSLPERELMKQTARAFGIQTLGKNVEAQMRHVITWLIASGKAHTDNGRIEWAG